MTETEVANIALGKIGGAGDQIDGDAFIDDIDAGTDKVTNWIKLQFPVIRKLVITDLAIAGCPFQEASKFADLGAELSADDAPEFAQWEHVFNLPGDYLSMIMQFDEANVQQRYKPEFQRKFEVKPNKAADGHVLMTNDYTNVVSGGSANSAFIEYAFDLTNTGIWSISLIDCVSTRLAAEISPIVQKPEQRIPMLTEYDRFTALQAQAFNRTQSNNNARKIPDFRGGRNRTIRTISVGSMANHECGQRGTTDSS